MPERSAAQLDRLDRRKFLRTAAMAGVGGIIGGQAAISIAADTITMPFANGTRALVQFPQKRPLILLTTRPPQLETPFSVFNDDILTPNDAFFVRYHLTQIPTSIDPEKFINLLLGQTIREIQRKGK